MAVHGSKPKKHLMADGITGYARSTAAIIKMLKSWTGLLKCSSDLTKQISIYILDKSLNKYT